MRGRSPSRRRGPPDRILVLDFGSQTTQLIARRIRELHVYCEIAPFSMSLKEIRAFAPRGVVLSGGPASVYAEGAPACDPGVLGLGVPVLGICYGQQLMASLLGGRVVGSQQREFGRARVRVLEATGLFEGFDAGQPLDVWMSHGDRVEELPPGFSVQAGSPSTPFAAVFDPARRLAGLQFHPEVVHTPRGRELLANFVFGLCGCRPGWTMEAFIERSVRELRARIGGAEVLCGLSGGVDSAVAAALLQRAIGKQLTCIFVDNGLLRKGEAASVREVFGRHFGLELTVVDASARFLEGLAGVSDPERKRKIIGELFVRVFEQEARRHQDARFLAQGTLYPDVIESTSVRGPAATIKSHHNVGGLPEDMHLELVEPLRELFKDEVRRLGEALGLPQHIVQRQPFPGPGLGVRVVGRVTAARLAVLREADAILQEELAASGHLQQTWQAFAILLPVRSVGVMGDERTYEETLVVRAVTSQDGMTADWARLPADLLAQISGRITNEVSGVNRVLLDISSKPPATIEWE
ncbi:MAG TPA: glutamine-hydrolyzing GMP synthase [Myxococcota bacterium]|nr:glutamine-hydrolyzing GMP synthase [Myxococcota bacterium]HRY94020.1 glutamine-hydrolyzing GMP synthase [Myxococcota bacterium]HSA24133.1 glutamine-hydrolyzing GMP synthase [Myxococcota bacterium]